MKYALILTIKSNNSVAMTSLTGFESKELAEAAAKSWRESLVVDAMHSFDATLLSYAVARQEEVKGLLE